MAMLDSNLAQAWVPEAYGQLVDLEVDAKSVAFQVGTVVNTQNETIRFPLWVSDPSVAWYAENTQIALTDGATDEVVVTPKKTAGLTQISNEAVRDSNPAVADQVGRTLARQIAKAIDIAFFGNTTTNGPSGLLSVAYSSVDTGSAYTNLDLFHDAKATAIENGAELTHFVVAQDVANSLAKAKQATGSNMGLLATVDDGVSLAGVRVIVSPHVAAGEVWGLDSRQVMTVRRTGTEVVTSPYSAFAFDSLQVRATSRVGFGFVNPAGIVRLYDSV